MSAMERFWQLVARLDPFAKGDVTARDLRRHPVWKYALDWEFLPWRDETWRRPLWRRTVPWGESSLTVAAAVTVPPGTELEGCVQVTTIDGVVAVDGGGAWAGGRWFPLPLARKPLASAVGLKADEPFPVRWRLRVPLEGESEPRTGEFAEVETPEDEAADSDFP